MQVWTIAADVWSFGVVLAELSSRGNEPYVVEALNYNIIQLFYESYVVDRIKFNIIIQLHESYVVDTI